MKAGNLLFRVQGDELNYVLQLKRLYAIFMPSDFVTKNVSLGGAGAPVDLLTNDISSGW